MEGLIRVPLGEDWLSPVNFYLEHGEDPSLLEFKAIQYERRGNATAIAEQLQRIEEVPKREFVRRGDQPGYLEKICRKEPVRVSKLARALTILQQWESEN